MDPLVLRLVVVVAVVAVATLAGWWWNHRSGRLRSGDDRRVDRAHLVAMGLDLSGATVGAVLVGSPTCAPCVVARRVLDRVQETRDGFRWVYADASEHLPFVRDHGILRVPTLLVVDRRGWIIARTSGVPRAHEIEGVLDAA
ncbi:MAG: thioredoxin family protein [Nitriliruptoraceae bacterium]